MEEKSNVFLETEPVGKLMAKYAVPCVISLLVAALYNVVDQIFIANATYLGSFGNAANTVVFPMIVVALAIAVLIGDGCCAFVSLSLGGGREENAHKSIGSAIILCILCSVVLTAVYLIFMEPILTLFGGKVNGETYACAREYFFWISLGVPFYMFGQAMNPIIRSDGSPKFAMAATLAGAELPNLSVPDFPVHVEQGHVYLSPGYGQGAGLYDDFAHPRGDFRCVAAHYPAPVFRAGRTAVFLPAGGYSDVRICPGGDDPHESGAEQPQSGAQVIANPAKIVYNPSDILLITLRKRGNTHE